MQIVIPIFKKKKHRHGIKRLMVKCYKVKRHKVKRPIGSNNFAFNKFTEKLHYLPNYWYAKGFKGTLVNWALPSLHGGPLEITLTQSLREILSNDKKYLCDDSKIIRKWQNS